MSYVTEFTITDDHLKLMRRAYVRWEDCETGAPAIDCKRPYGNSWVPGDIAEILGWEWPGEDMPNALVDRALALHHETETVLQIACVTGSFATGRYVRKPYRYDTWRRA